MSDLPPCSRITATSVGVLGVSACFGWVMSSPGPAAALNVYDGERPPGREAVKPDRATKNLSSAARFINRGRRVLIQPCVDLHRPGGYDDHGA